MPTGGQPGAAPAPPTTAAKVVDFVAFQALWFALVLGAAHGAAWIGVLGTAVWIVVHAATRSGTAELRTVAAVTVLGVALDHAAVALGVQVFADGSARIGLVPVWIAALWAGFATTLRSSFAWLHGRYALAAALGAVFGPWAYVGAEQLGALALGSNPRWLALAAVGAEWALAMPLAMRAATGPHARP